MWYWEVLGKAAFIRSTAWELELGICTLLHFPPDLRARGDTTVSSSCHHPSPAEGVHLCGRHMPADSFSIGCLGGWKHSSVGSVVTLGRLSVINNCQFLRALQAVGTLQKHVESPTSPQGIIKHVLDSIGFQDGPVRRASFADPDLVLI